MSRFTPLLTASLLCAALTACQTTPEPEVIEEPVVVVVPEAVDTCTPISALTRVVIPAETKVFYAITEIENPPYEPIQRREKVERIITPEEVIYVDSEGKQVLDLCDTPVGAAPEELSRFDDLGDAALQPQQIGGPTTLINSPIVDLDPNN